DKIDQAVRDQRDILMLGVEELSHRDRCGTLLPQEPEMIVLLRWERVFDKERAIRFQILAELDRLAGRNPLVDVLQKLGVVAQLGAEVFKQIRNLADVSCRLPDLAGTGGTAGPRLTGRPSLRRGAVGGHPGNGYLNADVPISLFHRDPGSFFDFAEISSAR